MIRILLLLAALQAAPPKHEIIRGRVTTDSGVAIANADVIVTMAPSAETFSAQTAADGRYSIDIPNGSGEYLVYVGTLGRKPYKQRITRTGADSIFTADAKLAAIPVATVAAVKVQAQKVRPVRSSGLEDGKGTSGTDKTFDGVGAALAPELQGNLDAMASMIPGIASTPNGISVFGLGSDQNQTTLNGLAFGGADLPRDAKTATRFQLSPWDPAYGGFAGALVAVTLVPGDNVARRTGHATLDHPSMQFSDPLAARTGQKFSSVMLSQGGTGPLVLDKYFYNYGAQFSRSTSSVVSLLSLDADALAHAGVSSDSAARLVQLLGAQGIPLRGAADQRTTTTATFMERIDHSPSATITGRAPSRTWSLTGYGRYAQTDAATITPTATPGYAGRSTSASAAVQGIHSAFFGADGQYLNELTSGVSFSDSRGTSFLDLPAGSVQMSSLMSDGSTQLGAASFGGNSLLANDMRTWSWETINQTTFLPVGLATLPLRLTLQSRFTGYTQRVPANRFGRFEYSSLADLAANQPGAYSRTLNASDRSGGEWIGAAALGGSWTRGRVVYTGGARIDANMFTASPARNIDVESAFGTATDHAPNGIAVSPRLGFNWYYTGSRPNAFGQTVSGTTSFFRGASQIRGGIGEFRSLLAPTLLTDAIGSTGFQGAASQLRCIGPAVPAADWRAFSADPSSVPEQCVGGASAFADSARAVTLFDRAYTAPRTWKGTLGWTHWNDFAYIAIDGTYALSLHQPGTIDLNFAGKPAFNLADEGGRQVFAPATSIAASSGAASPAASRLASGFGRVSDRVSDLRGDARQVSMYIMPGGLVPWTYVVTSFAYTYVDARSQVRGFDQSAIGDPRAAEWARSFVPRHSFVAQAYHYFARPELVLSASLRASSGLPYTPIVSGDVNGDGTSGDRAFVFDPATAKDGTVANGMRDLLTKRAARDCLASQVGSFAGRNACVGPWSATVNGSIGYVGTLPGPARRAHVTLGLLNILAGVDELVHGDDNLHGWGASALPDPVLYRVRGFDAANKRYLYDVNGRFGSASPGTTNLRAPFRLTLDVALDLGRSAAAQRLEQNLRVRPGLIGTRAPADTIKKRYMANFTDIYGAMLRLSDSLVLSREQIGAIQSRRPYLLKQADSIYTDLTTYLASLPHDFDSESALARANAATEAAWSVIYAETPFLTSLLTPGQIRRLPTGMRSMVTTPDYRGRFFFPTS